MPLISVCIPTYNSQAFIAETIDCVLQQTLQDFEIIITDNCSTDSTIEICNKYKKKDPRIFIHSNKENIGAFSNFNKGLSLAKGKYLKFLMSDDLLQPSCLERTVAIFDEFPSVKVVGCSQQNVDKSGKVIRSVSIYSESCLVPGNKVTKDLLMKMSNDIGAPSNVIMRRSDYGDGFNCSFYFFADFERWLQALGNGDYYYLNEPLSILRLHEQSGTTDNFKTFLFISDILKLKDLFASFMEKEGISNEEWTQIIEQHIISYIDYVLLEEKLSAEEIGEYILRMKSWVGPEHLDDLLKSMSTLIYYGFFRMHKLNIESRWNQGQVDNLWREIGLMQKTLPWKIAEPFRSIRSKLTKSKS